MLLPEIDFITVRILTGKFIQSSAQYKGFWTQFGIYCGRHDVKCRSDKDFELMLFNDNLNFKTQFSQFTHD